MFITLVKHYAFFLIKHKKMKKNTPKYTIILIAFASTALFFTACNYKKLIDYPFTESIFMPASVQASTTAGIYAITPAKQGVDYRYLVDKAANQFNIPLAVCRSAVNPSSSIPVTISLNSDTIAKLITAGKFLVPTDPTLTTELLPATAYTLPSSVSISNDSNIVNFNLSINLNFITNSALNTPKKRYAIAVGVNSSTTKLADTTKNLAVIFIDPALLILPTSNFTTYIDNAYKTLGVINTSLNAYTYSWDFGDGTTSTNITPSKKYTASGTYNVTLTATGITGATSVKTTSITIP